VSPTPAHGGGIRLNPGECRIDNRYDYSRNRCDYVWDRRDYGRQKPGHGQRTG
jgi:hypothetical protein